MCGGHSLSRRKFREVFFFQEIQKIDVNGMFIKHNINKKQIREIIKMHAKWDTFRPFVLHIERGRIR